MKYVINNIEIYFRYALRVKRTSTLRHIYLFISLATALLIGTQQAFATTSLCDSVAGNLIQNCGFELGRVAQASLGFTSQYAYASQMTGTSRTFDIGTSPAAIGSPWTTPKATNSGSYEMFVDGATSANVAIWREILTILPNTTYDFSAFFASAANGIGTAPPTLAVSADGVQIGTPYTGTTTAGVWQKLSALWYSGNNTTVDLTLTDLSTVHIGNDFALDDFIFVAVPEPSAFLLLLSGLTALFYLHRRRGQRPSAVAMGLTRDSL